MKQSASLADAKSIADRVGKRRDVARGGVDILGEDQINGLRAVGSGGDSRGRDQRRLVAGLGLVDQVVGHAAKGVERDRCGTHARRQQAAGGKEGA